MFLAWNEMKNNKLRFSLIIGVLMLVSYLVFFLSGLASGLQDFNKAAVDKWDATGVILTKESDVNLPQSSLLIDDFKGDNVDEVAVLGQLNAIASVGDNTSNIAVFGIKSDEFIMPQVTEGKPFNGDNEVIAADSLKEDGFKIGDTLKLSSTDVQLKITGFTENAKFNGAPVLYGDLKTFDKIRFGEAAENNANRINGFVIRTNNLEKVTVNDNLDVVDTMTFIENLPGFSEQNLTLNFMIYFLFAISAVILAIFLYVLTIQKISIFGVMKAQGISGKYLAMSVIAQTFLLAISGVFIGFILTILTGQFLPAAVPVAFDYGNMAIYAVILIAVSIFGALFSVLTIVKIDPLEAIGG